MSLLEKIKELSSVALTVRAQAISMNDVGKLRWDMFFPRFEAQSMEMRDIITIDDRAVADRREWDAPGRLIPLELPKTRDLEFIPIESYFPLGEKEIGKLMTQMRGNEQLVSDVVGASLPQRVDSLVKADYRRLELDCVRAWTKGDIIVVDPQTGRTYTASFNIEAGRIQQASTAWAAAGQNAWENFLAWLEDAKTEIGGVIGVAARLGAIKTIQADAPTLANGKKLNRRELESEVQDELGTDFAFLEWEDSLDVFVDGGTTKTRQNVFPADTLAAIPAGTAVGKAGFAPVDRAFELMGAHPEAGVDVNGVTVYYTPINEGKGLKTSAQLNAYPVPDDQKTFVINIG